MFLWAGTVFVSRNGHGRQTGTDWKKHPEEIDFISDKITKKMFASQNNCVFVNFYQEDDEPIFGVDDFYAKIQTLCD